MPDRITAISFDSAVMSFGIWCENKLAERNDDHQPLWTLDQLLGTPETIDNAAQFAALRAIMGGG